MEAAIGQNMVYSALELPSSGGGRPFSTYLMKVAEAKHRLGIPEIAALIFPEWRPGKACRCPWRDDRSASFSVSADGSLFNDFATGEGGDQVAFLSHARGISMREAAREFIQMAGGGVYHSTPHRSVHPTTTERPSYHPSPMPDDVATVWSEGREHLAGSADLQLNLARWRGWSSEAVSSLADASLLACPLHHGRRVTAWKVEAPRKAESGLELLAVGYHARVPAENMQGRASWRFAPTERSHGRGIPSLPFMLGTHLPEARRIVVTEGQWDSVSLAIAWGWPARSFPPGVALVALRGAQGIRPFLESYRQFWPKGADAVLIPDNDPAGRTWHTPHPEGKRNLVEKMAELCARVRVVKVPGDQKDLNDALRGGALSPVWAAALLEN